MDKDEPGLRFSHAKDVLQFEEVIEFDLFLRRQGRFSLSFNEIHEALAGILRWAEVGYGFRCRPRGDEFD